jgi:alpha-D-xyloside xylohydrolase
VYVDGKLVLDRWRQNWAAWYHNFDVAMQAGIPVAIKIDWIPNDGYLRCSTTIRCRMPNGIRSRSRRTSVTDRLLLHCGREPGRSDRGYRALTGKAVMLPRWAYGFWQSRQRLHHAAGVVGRGGRVSQAEDPARQHRHGLVLLEGDQWGSHQFDKTRFPDPKAMLEKVHGMNAHFMISVWPKFYPGTDNYKELDAAASCITATSMRARSTG